MIWCASDSMAICHGSFTEEMRSTTLKQVKLSITPFPRSPMKPGSPIAGLDEGLHILPFTGWGCKILSPPGLSCSAMTTQCEQQNALQQRASQLTSPSVRARLHVQLRVCHASPHRQSYNNLLCYEFEFGTPSKVSKVVGGHEFPYK